MPHTTAMENHKEKFEDFCKATFIDGDNKGSKTITRAKGEKIIKLLSKNDDDEEFSPKKTRLITHSALGLCNVLCLPAKSKGSHKFYFVLNTVRDKLFKLYRIPMIQPYSLAGDEWPMWKIFSKSFTRLMQPARDTLAQRRHWRKWGSFTIVCHGRPLTNTCLCALCAI